MLFRFWMLASAANHTSYLAIFVLWKCGSDLEPGIKRRRRLIEFKLTRQALDSNWEFLKIENEQIKTAQKIFMKIKLRETTNLCVEIMNIRWQAKGRHGHVVQIRVCRLTSLNVKLYLSSFSSGSEVTLKRKNFFKSKLSLDSFQKNFVLLLWNEFFVLWNVSFRLHFIMFAPVIIP